MGSTPGGSLLGGEPEVDEEDAVVVMLSMITSSVVVNLKMCIYIRMYMRVCVCVCVCMCDREQVCIILCYTHNTMLGNTQII